MRAFCLLHFPLELKNNDINISGWKVNVKSPAIATPHGNFGDTWGDLTFTLKKLLAANKRLNTAYLLKESFDRLWTYTSAVWMRKFFDNWRGSIKWQRLKPFEKFAALVERNWEGLAAYCTLEQKPSLGFVEGLNNKIRVIQRRAYGLRDKQYLRLKILTSMLPDPQS